MGKKDRIVSVLVVEDCPTDGHGGFTSVEMKLSELPHFLESVAGEVAIHVPCGCVAKH